MVPLEVEQNEGVAVCDNPPKKIERISTHEAAQALGVCDETVRRLHRSKVLNARLFPRGLMFEKESIEKLARFGKDPVTLKQKMTSTADNPV